MTKAWEWIKSAADVYVGIHEEWPVAASVVWPVVVIVVWFF